MKKESLIKYLVIIFGMTVLFYLFCFVFKGRGIDALFVSDVNDTFMDHFNSIVNNRLNPYKYANSNYPAMACLIYKFMNHIIPDQYNKYNSFELRNNQIAMVGFMIYIIAIVSLIIIAISNKLYDIKNEKTFFIISIFISAPMMFAFERGNIILLSFALALFFCLNYDSENKIVKELALLSLAMSAAIKIYPAILGLLVFKSKDYKATIRLVIYGFLLFFLPFFYYDGIESINTMFSALGITSNLSDEFGYGVNVSLFSILKAISIIWGHELGITVIRVITFLIAISLLFVFFMCKEKYISVLALIYLIIFLPKTNYYYIMIFLIIPFVFFVESWYKGEIKKDLIGICLAFCFALELVPFTSGKVSILSDEKKFHVSFTMLTYYIINIFILILLLLKLINRFFNKKNMVRYINVAVVSIFFCFTVVTYILAIIK